MPQLARVLALGLHILFAGIALPFVLSIVVLIPITLCSVAGYGHGPNGDVDVSLAHRRHLYTALLNATSEAVGTCFRPPHHRHDDTKPCASTPFHLDAPWLHADTDGTLGAYLERTPEFYRLWWSIRNAVSTRNGLCALPVWATVANSAIWLIIVVVMNTNIDLKQFMASWGTACVSSFICMLWGISMMRGADMCLPSDWLYLVS